MEIRREPYTEDLDFFNKMSVDMLPRFISEDLPASIGMLKDEYLGIRNDSFEDSRKRHEQCLFRLYEAWYLVTPRKPDVDLYGYAFDDDYHASVLAEVSKLYDRALADQEYTAALECVRQKDYDTASKHFKIAAVNGHPAAQYNYGVSVTNGEGMEADATEGAFWYFTAAKNGYTKAMINLAIAYRRGTGVTCDGNMMLYWYATAASLPDPYGVYNLGLSLQNEEVLTGNSGLGTRLKVASERLDEDEVRVFAQRIASQVIDIMKKHAYNI